MTRASIHAAMLTGSAVLAALFATSCSPIVGASCAEGLTRCGRMCFDTTTDEFNCGACASACTRGWSCQASACVLIPDAAVVDAHVADAAHPDAARPDASARDSGIDARLAPDADLTDASDAATLTCGLGELACASACVRPATDPMHCGGCMGVCGAGERCVLGACAATCGGLTDCAGLCADLARDAAHCGACTTDCGAGVCNASRCEPAAPGHLVVIGHDYERRRTPMSTLLANAVLLPARSPVRIVGWSEGSTAAAIDGTDAALEDGRGTRGYVLTLATAPSDVPVLLETADTFLIYGQAEMSDDALDSLGRLWGAALREFLDRGGVIVLLDAPSPLNAGTYRILSAAGLFAATASSELVTPRLEVVTARVGDAVVAGVPASYRGEDHTVFFSTIEPDAIVAASSGPVVFARTYGP